MKKIFLICLSIFLTAYISFGQPFEGKITYSNVYHSKMPNVTDGQLTTMMGEVQEYFIKHGNYKSTANGTLFQSQYYVNKENRLYTKMSNSDVFLWNDGSVNAEEILKTELNKGVIEIMGYKCDELILTCKTGVQKYYFNSSISVDNQLFENHKFGNWYDFVSRSHSLPLKSIIDNPQFLLESTATNLTGIKLDDSFFELPAGSKTMKSPN